MKGYVPLYRKIMEWEWYDEGNTMRLFIHCLLNANHKDNKWRGTTVKKGSFITSIGKLAEALKLSKQNIRTALKNLQLTNEITTKSTHHYTTINIVNWAIYEVKDNAPNTPTNTQLTRNQHTPNTRLTTNKNDKNEKNDKNSTKKTSKKDLLLDYSNDFKNVFKDFKEMRQRMKAPLTVRAITMLLNKLKELSKDESTQIAIMEQSIMSGWKTVYPLKKSGKKEIPNDVKVDWFTEYKEKEGIE